jgi:hypothetical protein
VIPINKVQQVQQGSAGSTRFSAFHRFDEVQQGSKKVRALLNLAEPAERS